MSVLRFDHDNRTVEMRILKGGLVRGSVFNGDDRFNAVEFKVGGQPVSEGEKNVSISFASREMTGNGVESFFEQMELARDFATEINALSLRIKEDAPDVFIAQLNNLIAADLKDRVAIVFAMTPAGMDVKAVKKVIRDVVANKTFGDITTGKGLALAPENFFHALFNVATIAGFTESQDEDVDPNEWLAAFLSSFED